MIITKQDISQFCRSCTTEDSIANGHIYDVESAIIMPALGVTLYNAIQANPESYTDLLNGCQWTDDKGNAYYNDGLIRAEAYYAYSHIIRGGNATATRYGYVSKTGDYSQAVTEEQVVRDASQVKAQADLMLARVLAYCDYKGYRQKKQRSENNSTLHISKIGE